MTTTNSSQQAKPVSNEQSNAFTCYWFVVMMLTGVGLLKATPAIAGWVIALVGIGFVGSAWFFMDGLLSALRPAQPQSKLGPNNEAAQSNR